MGSENENTEKTSSKFKFKSLNVYSSDEWMQNSTKKYRTVYDKSETTYISAEFAFFNKLFDEQDWEANLCLKGFSLGKDDARTEICKLESKRAVKMDENIVTYHDGWGNATPGAFWNRGDYLWEAYIDGEVVGSKKFHVEDVGLVTVDNNPYFSVESVKLYSGDYDRIDEGQRKYIKKFNRDETPYVWVEFKFKNKISTDYFYEITINFYDDAGQPKASIVSADYVKSGSEGEVYEVSEGWGSSKAGGWKDDKYTVEIVFMDTLVAVAPFEVGTEEVEGEPEIFTTQVYNPITQQSTIVTEPETLEDVMKSLEELIGLGGVKQKIKEHIKYIDFLKLRKEKGFKETEKISLHSVFTGNPGTGKTTVVSLLGKIYNKMGLLSKGHVVEVDRADLVAPFIGQTAPKVKKLIDDARGGILFIDEAYSLAREGDDEKDFGKEVIEILLKEMSDGKGDIAIMAAGYPKEMEHFLDSNPGIKSRFAYHFHFDDYLPDELMAIADLTCVKRDVKLSEEAHVFAMKILTEAYRNRDRSFGNARFALSIIDEGKMNLGLRLMNTEGVAEMDADKLSTIELVDVEQIVASQMKKRLDLKIDEELLSASLSELKSLTGMNNIKQEVTDLVKLVRYYRETGKDVLNKFSLHSVFTGNPGTGKTTVARIMGKIYKSLGLLERGHVVECDRERLVAGFIGQTAIKTKELIDQAKGGVLFIDEAYALAEGEGNDYGKEAIEVILKNMEDMRGELAVIVAGYPDNMKYFLESNPGLKSRFDQFFQYFDFTADELYEILIGMLQKENLTPDAAAEAHLKSYFEWLFVNKDRYFGNARTVRNIAEDSIRNQQLRMAGMESGKRTKEMIETLTVDDLKEFQITDGKPSDSSIGFKLSGKK
jgi:SpoVK/Ycf46/Vps4 family AAA+-type ATPase